MEAADTNEYEFFKGKIFENEEEAKNFIANYNKKHFTEFVIVTNNKRSLVVACKYGYNRPSESKGIRRNLHYNFVDCKAKINMFKSQVQGKKTLKVTSVNIDHSGHVVDEDVYNRLNINITEEETELIKTLAGGNAKPSQIKRILLEKSKKRVTIQKIKNLVAKIKPLISDEDSQKKFLDFLVGIEEEGGVIEWNLDPDQTVKALFITSSKMKSAFRNNNPPVVQLDTSFNMEKAQYKVAAFAYLDPNSMKTELAAFSFLSEESALCFEFILTSFSKICVCQDLIFLIDKDFTEISSLKKIFPISTVLLCIFHALKYMRTLISTALARQEKKTEIFGQFKTVLYSSTQEVFQKENETFLEMVKNVEVKIRDKYVQLDAYYSRNWEKSKLMWVKCYRNSLLLLGDNTSNRVESSFGLLKKTIMDTFVANPKTIVAVQHLVEFADGRLKDRYLAITNKVLKIYHPDKKIRDLTEEASKELNDMGCKIFYKSLCRYDEKQDKMEQVAGGVVETFSNGEEKAYFTTPSSCSCTFFANYQAPCSHMIYTRQIDSIEDSERPIFDKHIFNTRYHRNKELINVLLEKSDTVDGDLPNDEELVIQEDFQEVVDCLEDTHDPPMNDRQKFKMVMPILIKIANIASLCGTKQFFEHFEDLQSVKKRLRRGNRIYPLTDKEDLPNVVDDNNNFGEVERTVNSEDAVMDVSTNADDDLDDTVPQESSQDSGETISKFASLKFKDAVKTRGRPRKKSKQVSFNKTALDRVGKRKKQVRKTTKKGNPKGVKRRNVEDFINDEEDEETDFSSSEADNPDSENMRLDDDDEEDLLSGGSQSEQEIVFNKKL